MNDSPAPPNGDPRTPASRGLSKPFSLYLDVVRLGAALVVALSHVWPMVFPSHPLPWPGHSAVVVFFVLSGFVVAHATDNGRPASVYVQHRLARLWSVALPALAVSVLAAVLLPRDAYIYAAPPALDHWTQAWSSVVLNATFLAQSWGISVAPPYNSPFWSLSFEAWYYVLFGLWTFAPARSRLVWVALAALVAGPKILLLLPIWLMGVWAYRAELKFSPRTAGLLFLVSAVLGLTFYWFDASVRIREAMIPLMPDLMASLRGANQFVGDTLLGLIVTLNFIAAANLTGWLAGLQRVERPCRLAASFTFSIYLFHMPLFALIWGVANLRSPPAVVGSLAVGIVLLGMVGERQLPLWRRWAAQVEAGLAAASRRARLGGALG